MVDDSRWSTTLKLWLIMVKSVEFYRTEALGTIFSQPAISLTRVIDCKFKRVHPKVHFILYPVYNHSLNQNIFLIF